ncbi:hypothetical protein ACPEEZ_12490 [Frigoribacterium sp. 2-23]|uniref:hypothetical protein n=1 Tax=Frigoribacterium sp. 2-23 TaxID=3415006 RepID=UPI003C6EC6DE
MTSADSPSSSSPDFTGHGTEALDADFDIREFTRTAQGNLRSELDLEAFAADPVSTEALDLLQYLGRLESATMENLRNLLVTATHKDARVTAFLVTWAFEKFWLSDAIDAVQEAHGRPRGKDVPEGPTRHAVSELRERRGPIVRAVQAIGLGIPIVAVHTTTGVVDEWIMRSSYERLVEIADNEPLSAVVDTILRVKSRHEEFFADESKRRLAESSRAVKQTRTALEHAVWPVGAIERSDADRTMFERLVFGDAAGRYRADAIGARVAALPGMDARIGDAVSRKLAA